MVFSPISTVVYSFGLQKKKRERESGRRQVEQRRLREEDQIFKEASGDSGMSESCL